MGEYKRAYDLEKVEKKELRQEADEAIRALKEKIKNLSEEKRELLEKYSSEIDGKERHQDGIVKGLHDEHSKKVKSITDKNNLLLLVNNNNTKDIIELLVDSLILQIEAQEIQTSSPAIFYQKEEVGDMGAPIIKKEKKIKDDNVASNYDPILDEYREKRVQYDNLLKEKIATEEQVDR